MYSTSFRKPNPNQLLRQIEEQNRRERRGKLKIFFGSCPGVGKTYAMLQAAHERLSDGVDVVAGIVETHKRPETKKLLEGIVQLPPLMVEHRGIALREFDLNAALARKPSIILVDELAHTNASSMRHPKRWSDVEELLEAGIDVYTTLNVQHIESLSDVVAGTTGIWVKETIPDSVFDQAEDIILIDINIDELLKRLNEGKVYIKPESKARAIENFFRHRNLIALREIALRRTAERVDAQMHALIPDDNGGDEQPIADKIMVCVGPDPLSVQLVRTAKRTATSLKAPWTALYIENMRHFRFNREGREAVQRVMRMAERIGGTVAAIQGDNVVDEIIAYARANRVTKIVIGKTIKPFWQSVLFGSLADKIIRKSGSIDVYIVTGKQNKSPMMMGKNKLSVFRSKLYLWSFAVVAILTVFGMALTSVLTPIDQALIYLIGVILVAAKLGRGPSFVYSLLSVTCFNFFFVPPLFSLDIYDRSYWLTFGVMLFASFVITNQASRLRLQAIFARKRERETQAFYSLTRQLTSMRGHQDMADVTARHVIETFALTTLIGMPDSHGQIKAVVGSMPSANLIKENSVAQWCFDNGQIAGRRTTAMPSAAGLYFPLLASSGRLGVLGVISQNEEREFTGDEITAIETCANLLASALERATIADSAQQSKVEAEGEKLRTILLSSVSHDLRTPLASITGAASTIATDIDSLSQETVRELGRSINQEAGRLSHLVSNLLEVTRFESGAVNLNKQPYFIEELIGSALTGLEHILAKHEVITQSVPDLPLVLVDGVLIEQVLINLIENAAHYTPAGSLIQVSAIRKEDSVLISVIDNGPGIPLASEEKIFDKFYSIGRREAQKGTGLGLAICAGILKAHKGEIWAKNISDGGAGFYFTLPIPPNTENVVENAQNI